MTELKAITDDGVLLGYISEELLDPVKLRALADALEKEEQHDV